MPNTLDVNALVGITISIKDDKLEDKMLNVFREIGVEIGQCDIQACHRVKNNQRIVNFSNRKDCLQILRVKKQLKDLDCTLSKFPIWYENICKQKSLPLRNENLFYCGIYTKQSRKKINFTNFTP